MYVPYITKAHGNRSVIMNYDYFKREFKKHSQSNILLLMNKEDECIAGISLLCTKSKASLGSLGIKDGNLDYLKYGVPGILYYFSISYLREKGFTSLILR